MKYNNNYFLITYILALKSLYPVALLVLFFLRITIGSYSNTNMINIRKDMIM